MPPDAPSPLGDIQSLTQSQFNTELARRRKWLQDVNREYAHRKSDTPHNVVVDMARVTAEMDQLIAVGDVKFPNPLKDGMIFADMPHSHKSGVSPSPLMKAGYWSKPFVDAISSGQKSLTSGVITVPALSGGYVPIPDRPRRVMDVISSDILRGTNSFAYLREKTRTLNALEVAGGGVVKPTTTLTMEKVEDVVVPIATLSEPISRYDLEDTGLLQRYVESALTEAVLQRLDSEIINGDNVGDNLNGMLNQATGTQAFVTDILTTTRKAVTQLTDANYPSGVFIFGSGDWEAIDLTTLTTGEYLFQQGGGPIDTARQRLWSQPVVVTSALTDGTAILFVPDLVVLKERDAVQVDWSSAPEGTTAGATSWEQNQVRFRAEGRWGLAIERPSTIIKITTA